MKFRCPGNRPLKWMKNLFFHTFDNIVFMPFENVCSTANKNVKFAGLSSTFLGTKFICAEPTARGGDWFRGKEKKLLHTLSARQFSSHSFVCVQTIYHYHIRWLTDFLWVQLNQFTPRSCQKLIQIVISKILLKIFNKFKIFRFCVRFFCVSILFTVYHRLHNFHCCYNVYPLCF